MRIGVLCPSEIAYRRFLPAIRKIPGIQYIGMAVNSVVERYGDLIPDQTTVHNMMNSEYEKAGMMINDFGGMIFKSYSDIISSSMIDAIYIPLPPALHYRWAKEALMHGKHVLVEKPSTTVFEETKYLTEVARERKLALYENYMFVFHRQMEAIQNIISSGELGEVRLYRISFGFPRRKETDFRYNRALGGGALLDAGGYTIKCADWFLGDSAKVVYAKMNEINGFEVDMFGSGTMVNDTGITAQIAFGMDNEYKCELEVWGSKGVLTTGRILTAPAGFTPSAFIKKGNQIETIHLPEDDAFGKSIMHFRDCIENISERENSYNRIIRQAKLVSDFERLSRM